MMSTVDARIVGGSLISAFTQVSKAQVPVAISALAKAGAIDVLEFIQENGLLDETLWPNKYMGRYDLAFAILPILDTTGQRERAEKLVHAWLTRFDAHTAEAAAEQINNCQDATTLRHLVRIGGSAFTATRPLSYLMGDRIREDQPTELPLAIILGAADIGDLEPLENALGRIVYKDDDYHSRLLQGIKQIPLDYPPFEGFARGAIRNLTQRFKLIEDKSFSYQTNIALAWSEVLTMADMRAEDWLEIHRGLSETGTYYDIIASRSSPELEAASGRVVSNIAAAGVRADDILVVMPGKRDPVPLLVRAIHEDNAALARVLIDAGADPDQTVKYQGKTQRVSAFAKADGQTAPLLAAWRARQALGATAAAARKSSP